MKKTTLAILSMATLTACGGGGSSDSNTKDPVTPSTAITMSGKAIDGYIQGAAVYLDLNFNRQWDDGEPQTTTNAAGDYRLELPEELQTCAQYAPLVVDVPAGAIDLDLGPVTEAYQMVLPPTFAPITQDDAYHVTPFTTVLWSSVESELAADSQTTCQTVMANQQKREQLIASMKQAVSRVVDHYNISEQKLYADFVASGDSESGALAQEIVRGLQQSFTATEALKKARPDAKFAYVDFHKGDSRDNNNGYPDAWYRETILLGATKSSNELVKVSDDFSQVIKTIIYGEQSHVAGSNYNYSNSYEFESRQGDNSPYSCDIKETISTNAAGKSYSLVNLANGAAETFEDCVPDNMADAITHRYAFINYSDNGLSYASQFIYNRQSGSFGFLNNWVGLKEQLSSLDMSKLTTTLEALPYSYNEQSGDPDATFWIKSMTASDNGNTIRTSYDSQGKHQKQTTFADGTHSLECGTDGITWGACK
jgi:hypothetical protein